MECPYCKKEMSKGYIYSGKSSLCWTPIQKKHSSFINHPEDYEILLAKYNYIKGCRVLVDRCSACKIEIIKENDVSK